MLREREGGERGVLRAYWLFVKVYGDLLGILERELHPVHMYAVSSDSYAALSHCAGGMEDTDLPDLGCHIASSLCLKQLYMRS